MDQQFGSPVEEVRFTRIQFRGALVLANRRQRVPRPFFYVAQQVMHFGPLLPGEQGMGIQAGVFIFS